MSDNLNSQELRLYCVMRNDLEAPIGKLIAQAGHAFIGCLSLSTQEMIDAYINDGMQPKIVLKSKNEHELLRAESECKTSGINCYLVTDAGRTVFAEPTITCLGIGPVTRDNLPKFIQKLRLLD